MWREASTCYGWSMETGELASFGNIGHNWQVCLGRKELLSAGLSEPPSSWVCMPPPLPTIVAVAAAANTATIAADSSSAAEVGAAAAAAAVAFSPPTPRG